jgi:hypothetical protein
MDVLISHNSICSHSVNIVAREIEGEIVIVPLVAGIGDLENELFTLNPTGKAIWRKLDGKRTLGDLAHELSVEYAAAEGEIEKDVMGLAQELAKRKMIDVLEHA